MLLVITDKDCNSDEKKLFAAKPSRIPVGVANKERERVIHTAAWQQNISWQQVIGLFQIQSLQNYRLAIKLTTILAIKRLTCSNWISLQYVNSFVTKSKLAMTYHHWWRLRCQICLHCLGTLSKTF